MKHTTTNTPAQLKLILSTPLSVCECADLAARHIATATPDDAYFDFLFHESGRNVRNTELHHFLIAVLAQTEVRWVLTRPVSVGVNGRSNRIEQLLAMSRRINDSGLQHVSSEVIFVACTLYGVQYWLGAGDAAEGDARGLLRDIAQDHLQTLDSKSPAQAKVLRLCMGWGNVDEESELTEWIQYRIQQVLHHSTATEVTQ